MIAVLAARRSVRFDRHERLCARRRWRVCLSRGTQGDRPQAHRHDGPQQRRGNRRQGRPRQGRGGLCPLVGAGRGGPGIRRAPDGAGDARGRHGRGTIAERIALQNRVFDIIVANPGMSQADLNAQLIALIREEAGMLSMFVSDATLLSMIRARRRHGSSTTSITDPREISRRSRRRFCSSMARRTRPILRTARARPSRPRWRQWRGPADGRAGHQRCARHSDGRPGRDGVVARRNRRAGGAVANDPLALRGAESGELRPPVGRPGRSEHSPRNARDRCGTTRAGSLLCGLSADRSGQPLDPERQQRNLRKIIRMRPNAPILKGVSTRSLTS